MLYLFLVYVDKFFYTIIRVLPFQIVQLFVTPKVIGFKGTYSST